jgi:YbbR domain-containing protein
MRFHPFRHLGLKFFSITLAVLLWLTLGREPIVERTLRVPLQFQNIPATLLIAGEPPTAVDVRVRGASNIIGRLVPGEVVTNVDLASAKPGSRLFHLLPGQVTVPFDVTVEQVSPPTIGVRFERSESRRVPIVPPIDGEPAPGFVVGTIATVPAEVEITGPESQVRVLTEATTEPLSVEGAKSTVVERLTIGVTDPAVRLGDVRVAEVTVQIVPAPIERQVVRVPVLLRGLERGLSARATPPAVTLQARGTRERLANLTTAAFTAAVDVAGLGPGRYDLPVQVDAPAQVAIRGVDPPSVRLVIAAVR